MTRSHRVRLFMPFVLGLVLCVGGCRKDYKKVADRMVEENLLKLEGRCEAIGFFDQGGRFFDDDETTTVDRDVVLPLLKQVRETARTDQWVVPQPNNAKQALALLIELPDDQATIDRMAKDVEAADDKFSGLILQQWGHQWLSLNLIDQETAEFFKRTDPDLERQR